jgi:hypothetical protein
MEAENKPLDTGPQLFSFSFTTSNPHLQLKNFSHQAKTYQSSQYLPNVRVDLVSKGKLGDKEQVRESPWIKFLE